MSVIGSRQQLLMLRQDYHGLKRIYILRIQSATPVLVTVQSRSRKGSSIVSRASSRASSISAAKTKAAAKRAVLQAEAVRLERFHALQKEEPSIQQQRRALELETEIGKAQAEELVYVEAEADHVATPRSLLPAANRPTYSQSALNDCSSESRPPNNDPTLEMSDNGPQNFTEVPKVDKPLNPNADSWPCDDPKPIVKLIQKKSRLLCPLLKKKCQRGSLPA